MTNLFGKTATALAALSLATTPAIAQSASALSLRATTASAKQSTANGAPVIAIIGVAAIIGGGLWLILDKDDKPDSP